MAKQESRRADDERERTAAAVQAAQQVQPPRDSTIDFVLQEMAALRQQVASKDEKLLELATARPDSSSSDILLGKMVEGDSARMLAMRQQIDSELRMKNEMHKSEMDRLHSRYEDIARRQEDAHQRELTMAGQSTENGQALLKLAYESQIAGFQRELQMLSGQLQIAQSEVAILREKKDKSPVEHLTELAALKEALSTFAGSEKEEGGTIERMMNSALGSPLAEGIAARLAGVAPPAGAPDPQQQAVTPEQVPVNVPVHLPDGRIAVRKPDGTLVALQARKKPPGPTGEEGVTISDEDVGMAIQFMEAALASDTDPVDFARTARSVLTSGAIQAYLAAQGVDAFLARVANLKANSPLLQQHGKNWTRKVAAALLE